MQAGIQHAGLVIAACKALPVLRGILLMDSAQPARKPPLKIAPQELQGRVAGRNSDDAAQMKAGLQELQAQWKQLEQSTKQASRLSRLQGRVSGGGFRDVAASFAVVGHTNCGDGGRAGILAQAAKELSEQAVVVTGASRQEPDQGAHLHNRIEQVRQTIQSSPEQLHRDVVVYSAMVADYH